VPNTHDIINHVDKIIKKYTTSNGEFITEKEFVNIIKNDSI